MQVSVGSGRTEARSLRGVWVSVGRRTRSGAKSAQLSDVEAWPPEDDGVGGPPRAKHWTVIPTPSPLRTTAGADDGGLHTLGG